jgi:hypothetical protein
MQTSLVAPGTLRGLQFRALFQLPSPAFPVQVAVHVCACARLPPVTTIANKAPARKTLFTLSVFFIDMSFVADHARPAYRGGARLR